MHVGAVVVQQHDLLDGKRVFREDAQGVVVQVGFVEAPGLGFAQHGRLALF
jgi:hypothetical protein